MQQLSAYEMRVITALADKAGLAAKLLDAWTCLPVGAWQTARSITSVAQLGVTEERGAEEVLVEAEGVGLLSRDGNSFLPTVDAYSRFPRLALALHAIEYYVKLVHRDATTAKVVLTKPPRPSALETRLDDLGWRTSSLEPTAHAFTGMVQKAKHRIVVMTPFLDTKGAAWLKELFGQAQPGTSRLLVLRSLEDPMRPDYPIGLSSISQWLASEGVHVYNYSIPRDTGYGRETFHAKVVLCDDSAAYVGSSNATAASLEHSMEMGVAIDGNAARDVATIMEAVLKSATRIS